MMAFMGSNPCRTGTYYPRQLPLRAILAFLGVILAGSLTGAAQSPPVGAVEEAPLPSDEPMADEGSGSTPGLLDAPKELTQYRYDFDEFSMGEESAKLLEGREWTALTEIDPIFDEARKEEVLELLERARKEANLHFMVLTIKGDRVREYAAITGALISHKLALQEGGVVVCTDQPGVQITGYTTLLETHVGKNLLTSTDHRAISQANLAVGNSERGLTLVRVVVESLISAVTGLKPGSETSAADALFDLGPDPILTETHSIARRTAARSAEVVTPAETKAPATGDVSENQDPAAPDAPAEPAPTAITRQPEPLTSGIRRPGLLVPILAGIGALLVLIAAGLLTRLAVSTLRRKRRRTHFPESGVTPATPETSTPPEPLPLSSSSPVPTADTAEPATASTAAVGVKPRMMEQRKPRRAPGAARREELQEMVDRLEQLLRNNRDRSATEPFDIDANLDRLTLQDIQLHYRALYKILPPSSRPGLTESLEDLLDQLRDDSTPGKGGKTQY